MVQFVIPSKIFRLKSLAAVALCTPIVADRECLFRIRIFHPESRIQGQKDS
jgi:hypothetical protein